jgi:hypothetical protein
MSHTTRVQDIRVHNVTALEAAVAAMNVTMNGKLTLKKDADCRLWGSAKQRCEAVVTVQGCRFDVGFEKAKDGNGLVPVFDAHGYELYTHLGQGKEIAKTPAEQTLCHIGKLMQAYAFEAIKHEALLQGASFTHTLNPTGQLVMAIHN